MGEIGFRGINFREMGRKKARLEMKGERKIVFIEVDGDLLGIDLNKYDYCDLLCAVPINAPICCRVELRKHGYPHGMSHMKVNDKLYLLGGECFDFNPNSSDSFLGYSDKVYEFKLPTQISDNINDEPLLLHPDHVLRPINPLLMPMLPLVANLRDRFYALYFVQPLSFTSFLKPTDPGFTFQKFDPINESWLPAPDPLFYRGKMKSSGPPEMSWPGDWFPISSHFVVDNKFLLFSNTQLLVHIFRKKKWKSYRDKFASISASFYQICNHPVPDTGLWLSNFGYDDANLGVMLSIRLIRNDDHHIQVPLLYSAVGLGYVFYETFKLYAYAINKKTCHVVYYQPLDEIFSDMLHTPSPLNTEKGVTRHILDLGESVHNSSSSRRRICAILAGDDLIKQTPYLYISIFELQLTQAPSSSNFLHVITPIKKLIFRLDKDPHRLVNTYNGDHVLFDTYDTPPLDAFVI